jgi:hypothetical protein
MFRSIVFSTLAGALLLTSGCSAQSKNKPSRDTSATTTTKDGKPVPKTIPDHDAVQVFLRKEKALMAQGEREQAMKDPKLAEVTQKADTAQKKFAETAKSVAEKYCGKDARFDIQDSGSDGNPQMVCYAAAVSPSVPAAAKK